VFIGHANGNICEYDYVVISNSLHLFNAVYQCHALKCALKLLNIAKRQASKQRQEKKKKKISLFFLTQGPFNKHC
jgi:hypothetical protein